MLLAFNASSGCVGDGQTSDGGSDATTDASTPDVGNDAADAADAIPDASPPKVVELAAGTVHACALFSDGHVDCWGDNTFGELGVPTAQNGSCNGGSANWGCRTDPVRVTGLTNAKHIAVGGGFTCAVDTQGGVSCWGLNDMNQLGHPVGQGDAQCTGPDAKAYACNPTPSPISNAANVVQITTGVSHACLRTQANSVACWGDNSQGELGNGSSAPSSASLVTPTGLPGPAADISAGQNYDTCIVTVNGGQVWCWGFGDWGQLGPGSPLPGGGSGCFSFCAGTPEQAVGSDGGPLGNAERVWLGHAYSCARATGGSSIVCWGIPDSYDITSGTNEVTLPIPAAAGTQGFTTDWETACTIVPDAGRTCWGVNTQGAIGDGTFTSNATPTSFALPANPIQLVAGVGFFVALDASGTVSAWGSNAYGQLGHAQSADTACGSTFCNTSPTPVGALP